MMSVHKEFCLGPISARKKKPAYKPKNVSVPCRFFLLGKCKSGTSCEFLHDKKKVCHYFSSGNCKFGDKCANLHPIPYAKKAAKVVEVKPIQMKKEPEDQFSNYKASNAYNNRPICFHFQKGKCDYGDGCYKQHILPPPGDFNNSKPLPAPLKKPFKKPPRLASAPVPKKEEEEEEWEYVPICTFFNRGACAYGDKCTKAHEKLPLYKKDVAPDMMTRRRKVPGKKPKAKQPPVVLTSGSGDMSYSGDEDEIFLSDSEYSDDDLDELHNYNSNKENINNNNNNNTAEKTQNLNIGSFGKSILAPNNQQNKVPVSYHQPTKAPVAQPTKSHVVVKEIKKEEIKIKAKEAANELSNLYEVLQASGESASESEEEEDQTEDEDEREEEEEDEEQDQKEEKQDPVVDKKTKKELKKQQKNDKLRIIMDNLRWQGNNQYEKGNFTKAIALYTSAISKAGSNINITNTMFAYNNRAAAFMHSGNFRLAFNDAKKCFEYENDNVKAQRRLLTCCEMLGLVDHGRNALKKIDDVGEEYKDFEEKFKKIEFCKKEALKSIEKDRYTKAENYINKALGVCEKSVEFLLYKATVLALKGDTEEADELINSLDQKDPAVKCCWYFFVQGVIYYYENELERSLSRFAEAKKDINKAAIWHEKVSVMKYSLERGRRSIKSEEFRDALEFFNDGFNLAMDNKLYKFSIYKERSTAYAKLKEYDAAIKDITLALDIEDDDSKLWMKRAKVYVEINEYTKALEDLEEAQRLSPTFEVRRMIEETKRKIKQLEVDKTSYYNILGVDRNADHNTIRQKFYAKAKMFHPDKHAHTVGAEKQAMENKMKEISRAWNVLSDSQKRADYDRKLYNMENDEEEDDYDDEPFPFTAEEFFMFIRSGLFGQFGGAFFMGR